MIRVGTSTSRKIFAGSLLTQVRKNSNKKYEKVGVVGLGLMGHGLAQISAQVYVTNGISLVIITINHVHSTIRLDIKF